MKIYVGNLPFSIADTELQQLFEQHGAVSRVDIVMDRETGRPRGFAFVEMPDDAEAQAAIKAVDGTQIGGRAVNANAAKPREDRGGGGGGGRGGYGGGGGRGGGGYGGGGGGGYGGGGGGGGRGGRGGGGGGRDY